MRAANVNLRELPLAATHSNWRLFMVRKADPAFLAFQQKVFKRDAYTCQFCGFCSKSHMEVVNLDNNFRNNRMSNMTTSCCICSQSFFLESVGRDEYGGGSLIVMPELSQNDINALCHNLFTAIISGNRFATQARNVYRSLKLRSQPTEKALGEGMSNPALLGRLLVDAGKERAASIQKQLQSGIRLLPDMQGFAEPVKIWIQEGLEAWGRLSSNPI